ncbi:cysteine proteinase [Neolentinus lepideus HHB14362 ss-1]|uniref:Cysteine proteinase n=1 Tax=Neolentinus lepideus HHB14362 ss-1 TaxID=1314782 RepID=A0A165SLG4_9AGAM|nr:cysteine proteinase [Neolentinus lepideus HHB14362 ss-1]
MALSSLSSWLFQPDDKQELAYEQHEQNAHLIVTEDLNNAIERCRKRVRRISDDCKKRNRRFRDIDFDIEEDQQCCLYGLGGGETAESLDVLRIEEIYDKPQFMIDGATGDDLVQGRLSDCWFLSALASVSTIRDLINKICVDHDPVAGVYGFIFYRDGGWVDIIVDDLLFIYAPKYENLPEKEKQYFRSDKASYDKMARRGTKSLYFASSGTENETWVPLIEKAFAKLHGDYDALNNGWTCDAVESLTGGVSNCFYLHDILDTDRFWKEELLKLKEGAEKDRVFSCVILNSALGLWEDHAYSIMEAIEHKGRRFLKIRNPWGQDEWTGPWSDGSKEWTRELHPSDIGHKFGDDGEFIMEYKDFLTTWTYVDRTRLFDDSWIVSSLWLNVTARSLPCAWNYGDVSYTIHVDRDTPAIIVLSRLDDRHFCDLSGCFQWSLDFAVYKQGTDELITTSTHERLWHRSVNVETDLEAGDYVVHARVDRRKKTEAHGDVYHDKSSNKEGVIPTAQVRAHEQSLSVVRKQKSSWDIRKLGRKWAAAYASRSIARNFDPERYGDAIPLDDKIFKGKNLAEIQAQANMSMSGTRSFVSSPIASVALNGFASQPPLEPESTEVEVAREPNVDIHSHVLEKQGDTATQHKAFKCNVCGIYPIVGAFFRCMECAEYDICQNCMNTQGHQRGSHITLRVNTATEARKLKDQVHGHATHPEDYEVTLGLRVYTKKEAPATIKGQLRQGDILRGMAVRRRPL